MSVMNLETIRLGLNNLRLHKLRSLLTALGIIFGVAAVICMLSISEGASADELRMIQQLGTRNIIISSVKPPQSMQASDRNTTLLAYGITNEDVRRIATTIPHVQRLIPMKTIAYSAQRHDRRVESNVVGTIPEFFGTVHLKAARGRLLTATDEKEKNTVCVIGDQVRHKLFAYEDPIGQSIFALRRDGTRAYTVVGVLAPVMTAGAPRRGMQERDINAEVYIPYATASSMYGDTFMRRTAGSRDMFKMQLSGLYVTVDRLVNVLPVSEMVARAMGFGHEKLDYDIRVPLRSLKLAERKKRNSQILLGFIAGISLLVGGIGIMNIMLATVTERTREIGIRRALGAKRRHITAQFLVETVVLSTAGGLTGILLGYFGAWLITSYFTDWGSAIVRMWSVLISFGLSVTTGIVFGLWPAMKAARLDPIEALRYQ